MKVVIVGTGGAARAHAKQFQSISDCEVSAICGTNEARALCFASDIGSRAFTSMDQMLDYVQPDIVSVTTGEYDHEIPVLAGLDASAHVFCEKMLAHNIQSGEALVAKASSVSRQLGVNYNYRNVPAHQMIKTELGDGQIGDPLLLTAITHSYLWPHLLDTLRFIFGDPDFVHSVSKHDQTLQPLLSKSTAQTWDRSSQITYHPSASTSACLVYKKLGTQVVLSSTSKMPMSEHWWSFFLYGRKGFVEISRATGKSLNGTRQRGVVAEQLKQLPLFSYEDSFRESIGGFVDAIREGREVPITGQDALQSMKLDAAITKSASTGTHVVFKS